MTNVQKIILTHISKNFVPGSFKTELIGDSKVKVTDGTGESMTLTTNIYGDIMDADTRKIYAVSSLPHDLSRVGTELPSRWTGVAPV